MAEPISIDEQIRLAHESERLAAKRRWYAINEWGLMNTLANKFSLDNLLPGRSGGGGQVGANGLPMIPPPQLPFGNNIQQTDNSRSGAGMLTTAALAALALGGGGLGLAKLAGLLPSQKEEAVPSPPVVESVVQEKELPIFIDWEWKETDQEGVDAE